MTVVLVVCTLLLFLAADYLVQRVRASRVGRLAGAAEVALVAGNPDLPADVELLINHTWTRQDDRGNTVLGMDALLARALGAVENVLLPEPGSMMTPATADITLAAGARSLELASPVPGRVVEVNSALLQNPSLAKDDPYGAGWLVKLRPVPDRNAVYASYVIRRPVEWLRAQGEQMKEFFLLSSPQLELVPVTMQDGGEPVEGVLQGFDDEVWDTFKNRFATLRRVQEGPDYPQEMKQ